MGAGCAERFMSGSARGSGCDSPGLLSPCTALATRKETFGLVSVRKGHDSAARFCAYRIK